MCDFCFRGFSFQQFYCILVRRSQNEYLYMEGINLFQKKEVIFSDTIGVCRVDDIVKLSDNKKDTYHYYLLRSVFDKAKKAYIPVENHTVHLRALISSEEALKYQKEDNFNEKSDQLKNEIKYVLDTF